MHFLLFNKILNKLGVFDIWKVTSNVQKHTIKKQIRASFKMRPIVQFLFVSDSSIKVDDS